MSTPDPYSVYLHCQTAVVDTCEELYGDVLRCEDARVIVFDEDEQLPVEEVKHCLSLALTYHDRKHLDLLGA